MSDTPRAPSHPSTTDSSPPGSAPGVKARKKPAATRKGSEAIQRGEEGPTDVPPQTAIPPSQKPAPIHDDDIEDIPPTPQSLIEARYNDEEEEKGGYGNPPKKHRFKKGQSGNPSGKRKQTVTPAGNAIQNIGHEIVEEMVNILLGTVDDLQVKPDDLVTTAIAKIVVGDGLKKDGAFRKFVLSRFLETPLQSERLTPVDKAEREAEIMRKMISAVVDPAVDDADLDAVLKEAADHHETYGEFGARRRKERKKRRKPHRSKS